MAIVTCEKCGKKYSEWAPSCPHCEEMESQAKEPDGPEKPAPSPKKQKGERGKVDPFKILSVVLFFLLFGSVYLNVVLSLRIDSMYQVLDRMAQYQEELIESLSRPR